MCVAAADQIQALGEPNGNKHVEGLRLVVQGDSCVQVPLKFPPFELRVRKRSAGALRSFSFSFSLGFQIVVDADVDGNARSDCVVRVVVVVG